MENKLIHTIIFEDDIDDEPTKKLIKEIEENQDKKILLFFSTEGGYVNIGEILVTQLNNAVENGTEIKLILFSRIKSTGFDVVMNFHGDIEILSGAHTVVHIMDWSISTKLRELRKDAEAVGLDLQYRRKVERDLEKFKEWGLSDEEIDILKNGEDIFLPYERLCDLVRMKKQQVGKPDVKNKGELVENPTPLSKNHK